MIVIRRLKLIFNNDAPAILFLDNEINRERTRGYLFLWL